MKVTIISKYVRGKHKQRMAMVVIHVNGHSYTRHWPSGQMAPCGGIGPEEG